MRPAPAARESPWPVLGAIGLLLAATLIFATAAHASLVLLRSDPLAAATLMPALTVTTAVVSFLGFRALLVA